MPVMLECSACGATFTQKPSHVRPDRNYCSNLCAKQRFIKQTEGVTFSDDGLTALIPLRNRRGELQGYATVDACDAPRLSQQTWTMNGGYAVHSELRMHRVIMGLTFGDGLEVDHRNRDKLDNRRSNLTVGPKGMQPQNKPSHRGSTSQYRGVSWKKRLGKWVAQIQVDKRVQHLGCFASEIEAAEAARSARIRLLPYAVD